MYVVIQCVYDWVLQRCEGLHMAEFGFPGDTTAPLSVRVPVELRDRLGSLAAANQRSLSQEVVKRLTESVWPSGASPVQRVFEVLNLPKVLRIQSSSTNADAGAVMAVVTGMGIDRLTFAARPNELNGATMVLILESAHTTLLMDGTWINMAREPRMGEVAHLMRQLASLDLLRSARYFPHLVDDTTELDPAQALKRIFDHGAPLRFDLEEYLDLLSVHRCYEIERFCLDPK